MSSFRKLYNHFRLSLRFAQRTPSGTPTFRNRVILLSYPRSGSSWVGKVLSQSPNSVYLREPITQPYLRHFGGQHTLVNLDRDYRGRRTYKMLTALAIDDKSVDMHDDIRSENISNAGLAEQSSLIIKEVNPRAATLFTSLENTTIVFLLRHPAAVAYSFSQMGWLSAKDTQMTPPDVTHADLWSGFGYAYGTIVHDALEKLKVAKSVYVIAYEELAALPQESFARLYEQCGLEKPKDFEDIINEYCRGKKTTKSGYDMQRDSKFTSDKWKNALDHDALESLYAGYSRSPLTLYRSNDEWR